MYGGRSILRGVRLASANTPLPLVLLTVAALAGCFDESGARLPGPFDSQGHRGARGTHPENSVAAFEEAVRRGMRTLELDVAVSADSQIVVSHEPYFNTAICDLAGTPHTGETSLFDLPYAAIAAVDCGSSGNLDFPDQRPEAAPKPLLAQVVAAARALALDLGRDEPHYNIEIKSKPEWDGTYTPAVAAFVGLVLAEAERLGITERLTVQSFDDRALRQVMRQGPDVRTGYLSSTAPSWRNELATLGFQPDVYSPHHLLLTGRTVADLHERGIRVVPWTVNDVTRMRTLIDWGVDGVITDYPARLAGVMPR